ncbi:MAG: hypothetical protein ACI4PQ_02635 [Butyricicoccaceae bacterium]
MKTEYTARELRQEIRILQHWFEDVTLHPVRETAEPPDAAVICRTVTVGGMAYCVHMRREMSEHGGAG